MIRTTTSSIHALIAGTALAVAVSGCSKPKETAEASSESTSAASDTARPSSSTVAAASASGPTVEASLDAKAVAPTPKIVTGTDPLFKDDASVVEGFDDGSAAFVVTPEGDTKIALASADGKPIAERSATMFYSIEEAGKTIEVPLHYDDEHKYLVAHGPELSVNLLTPVRYEIKGGTAVWTGVLHLPAGGTKSLNANAKVAAAVHVTPIAGPHGGRIERIGDDDIEVLVDPDSGEARAWIIVDGAAIEPKDRAITLVVDDRRVELFVDRNDSFYAKLTFEAGFSWKAVHKVTCVHTHVGVVSTLVLGFRPHVVFWAVRPSTEFVVVGWTKEKKAKWDKNPNEPGMGWAGGKEKHGGGASGGVSVDVHVGGKGGGGGNAHVGGGGNGGGKSKGKGKK